MISAENKQLRYNLKVPFLEYFGLISAMKKYIRDENDRPDPSPLTSYILHTLDHSMDIRSVKSKKILQHFERVEH